MLHNHRGGEGVSKMLMQDYGEGEGGGEGVDLVMT